MPETEDQGGRGLINTDPREFRKFHELLTKDEPGYEPFYFCLQRNGKDPRSRGSWKDEKKSFEEACALMEKGFNIGIAATDTDRLVIVDIDNMDVIGEPKPTLKNISRKRIGRHCFYFSDDEPVNGEAALFKDSAKQNIATEDAGEVRANWQYVVAAGSFVPCSEEEINRIPEGDRENAGKYAVFEPMDVSSVTYAELPETYRAVRDIKQITWKRNQIKQEAKDRTKTNEKRETKKSRLWDLDIYDLGLKDTGAGRIPMPTGIHNTKSETGGNCSINKGVVTCWRHNVTHGALTYLAVMAGISECIGAGYDHGTRGSSDVDFEDPETVFNLWSFAKSQGFVPADDPMPSQAMVYVATNFNICTKQDIVDGWKLPKKAYNKVIETTETTLGIETGRKPIETRGRPKKKTEGGDEPEEIHVPYDVVAERVMERIPIFTMADTKEFYIYRNGVYTADASESVLSKEIREEHLAAYKDYWAQVNPGFGLPHIKRITTNYINEVMAYIHSYRFQKRKDIDKEQYGFINLRNGVFNLKTWELEEHTPEKHFIRQIPVNYDADAECPVIDGFLDSVVLQEDKRVLYEWAGYSLIPDTKMQKAVMLHGTGSNGKSVFLNLLTSFVGSENISKESMQKLENDKFSVANLYGKLLNTFPDLPDTPLYKNDTFNTLTGDDKEISGEKKFRDSFQFDNTARLIFSANKLPYAKSDNFAYYRRWIIINFPYTFEGGKEDKHLLSKLTTESELSGFLNMALEGLAVILKSDKFSYNKSTEDVEKLYKLSSDPVAVFADTCIKASMDHTSKTDMYLGFAKWCDAIGEKHIKNNEFSKRLKKLGYTDFRENLPVGDGKYSKVSYWEFVSLEIDADGPDENENPKDNDDKPDSDPDEPSGGALLRAEMIKHAGDKYKLVVEDIDEFVNSFTEEYPWYRVNSKYRELVDYANIIKIRGWK